MSRNFELIKQLEQISPAFRRPALSQPITRPQPINRQEPAAPQEPATRPEPSSRPPVTGRQYSLGDAGILFGEEVVLLVHNVFLAHTPSPQTVIFCGVDEKNGSSVVCASAGRALAAISGKSVCLVDANLRDARLSKNLGIDRDQKPLHKTATLYDRCSSIDDNLSLAAADLLTNAYGGLPPAAELTQRLASLQAAFDFVLIDAPGVSTAKDAAILGAAAGAAILVIEAEKTRKPAAKRAKQSLEAAGVHVLGSVLRKPLRAHPRKPAQAAIACWPPQALPSLSPKQAAPNTTNKRKPRGLTRMTLVVKERSADPLTTASQTGKKKLKVVLGRGILGARTVFSPGTAANQSFLSLADQAAASITNFLTGVIIARASSKEEFGLYMLGFTLILLVTDLQTSLIATPYMVYAPRLKGESARSYAGSALIHQVVFSLFIMMALTVAAFASRFGLGPHGLAPVLWALAAVVAFIMLREFTRRIYFARLKLRSVFALDTCIGITQLSGLLLLAHFRLLSAATAYWLIGTACALGVAYWLWLDRRFFHVRLGQALQDLKQNWSFGKWVFASGLLATASTNLYPWLIAFFHGTAAAGIFAACLGVVSASNPILLGIQNLLGPKIAHAYAAEGAHALRRLVLKMTAILALPMCLLTAALMVWGDSLIGHLMAIAILATVPWLRCWP